MQHTVQIALETSKNLGHEYFQHQQKICQFYRQQAK